MATIFCESFDMYASSTDALTSAGGPWSATNGTTSATTQFSTGQSFQVSSTVMTATFQSGTNETTIFGSLRLKPNTTGTSSQYYFLQFNDSGTAQCTIRWNADGSVGLYTGGPTGTLISTTSSIYTNTVWNSFQFKVVINSSTGSIELRLNGSTSDAINATSINTRGGTSNAYANGLSMGASGVSFFLDDLYLNSTSGNNPVSWPGDLRAVQQLPSTCTTQTFSCSPVSSVLSTNAGTTAWGAGAAVYAVWTATRTAYIGSLTFSVNTGATANVKVAIYDNTGTGGKPGTALGTSTAISNPVAGSNTATFSSPVRVTYGTTYFIAFDQDASVTYNVSGVASSYTGTTTYSSFPATNPGSLTGPTGVNTPATTLALSGDNVMGIQELTEDGDTSYIYASSVQEDLYSVRPITTTYGVVAVQYYWMIKKVDAGARAARLSTNANSSGDTAIITSSGLPTAYTWGFATSEKDPTGAYWTPTVVNAQVLGVSVTA